MFKQINKQTHKQTNAQMHIFTNAQPHREIFPQMYIYLFVAANLKFKSHFTKQNVYLFV